MRSRKVASPEVAVCDMENAGEALFANLRLMSVDKPIHSIEVVSSVPSEGKTFVSVSLAQAIARSGYRTLLVECDLRRRSLAHRLGLHPAHGLHAVVSGEVALEGAIARASAENLFFLDAEPHIPNPPELLSSDRFASFAAEALRAFDYVVYDTPPVQAFVDAVVLARQVDATIMVVREGFTHRREAQATFEQLAQNGCAPLGIVMNDCAPSASNYYYDYYRNVDA